MSKHGGVVRAVVHDLRAHVFLPDLLIIRYSVIMDASASKVGRRGTIVLPAKLRRRLGIEEGSFVVAEERADGILIRPAAVVPVEIYTPERRAEFILNNAVGAGDYRRRCITHGRANFRRVSGELRKTGLAGGADRI
jgi:AbrB family looped-hinge helix DNA binding protein